MHLEHKPGETMQIDWAGQTAGIVDTDTGELIPAYLFVSVLPYSGYAYIEAFLGEKQASWITAHVHAYPFNGGVTRILTTTNSLLIVATAHSGGLGEKLNALDCLMDNQAHIIFFAHYGYQLSSGNPQIKLDDDNKDLKYKTFVAKISAIKAIKHLSKFCLTVI